MSSSDQLRRAAAKLRETAAKATPGPWYTVGLPWNHGTPYVIAGHPDPHGGKFVADVEQIFGDLGDDDRDHGHDAAWIALASPAIAEPLALWLDWVAASWPKHEPHTATPQVVRERSHALVIARAILGEAS